MNNEIEEMTLIISKGCTDMTCKDCPYYPETKYDCIDEIKATKLYNAGYRKQVWHKVADGDLPKEDGFCLVYCCVIGYDRNDNYIDDKTYTTAYYANNSFNLIDNNSDFIEVEGNEQGYEKVIEEVISKLTC